MKKVITTVIIIILIMPFGAIAENICRSAPLGVQVLGSGGPLYSTDRATTSYLVWVDGRAVVMVDVGGGSYLRFGQSGAELDTLSLLALTHFHPDHVADLPALLWLSNRTRKQPLLVSGPSGNESFPGINTFLQRMFDAKTGAFQVLSGTLGGPGLGVRLTIKEVDVTKTEITSLLSEGPVHVSSLPVPHGNAPSLAYRVEAGGHTIVFASDQNGTSEKFVEFARGADVLVMHLVVSPKAPEWILGFHALPKTVGQIAAATKAGKLVLSHLAQSQKYDATQEAHSLSDLEGSIRDVSMNYSDPVVVAKDLDCIVVN